MKHQGIEVLQRTIHPAIRQADAGADGGQPPVLDFVSSDETLDRYQEIIMASGWRLDNYRRNPVFQNGHNYGDVIFTLGQAEVTEVRPDGTLWQRIRFAVDVNPIAKVAYGLYRGGFLRAVSVGFIPHKWVIGGEGEDFRRKYIDQELIEVSAVSIPANPNALIQGIEAGAIARGDVNEIEAMLRYLVRIQGGQEFSSGQMRARPGGESRADATGSDAAQWLQLLDGLHASMCRH